MDLPRPIWSYLQSTFAQERAPAFLASDKDGRLCDFGGALPRYGLTDLTLGEPLAQQVYFLEGLLPLDEQAIFFPCLKTERGMVADVHLLSDGDRDYVLLLCAASDERQRFPLQQAVNDRNLRRRHAAEPAPSVASTLSAVVTALDVVVLRRVAGRLFDCVISAPAWALQIWPDLVTGSGLLADQDLFLHHFLDDAEAFWVDERTGALRSGIWCGAGGQEGLSLEAIAVNTVDEHLLLIGQPREAYENQRTAIQEARNRGLRISAMDRRELRLEEAHRDLQSRAAERTAELLRVNQVLQWELAQRAHVERQMGLLLHGIESTTEMIAITDEEGRLSFANRSFFGNHGYDRAEMAGQHVDVIWPSTVAGAMRDLVFAKNFDTGWTGDLLHRRKDGTEFPVSLTSSPVKNTDGTNTGMILVAQDLHEKRRTEAMLRSSEAQLRQAQKMEAIGKLAGGVAHDFNNLLTVILGYAEQLLSQGGPDTEGWAALLGIRNAGGRAAKLTQQLLAFSRKQILQPRVLDLHQVVTDMHALLRRLIGEDVALHTQSEPGLGRINADPGQMEQVLMNLAVNARQAMPTGGRLTIELSNVELDQSYSRAHIAVMPGDFVRLTVSDTGCGMDKETQARAFEPFFTTKAEGTGLGLSTVYGIVKQSGGNIWVYSEPGLGTAFKLYFPRVRDARQKRPEPIRSLALFDGTETILVVEDEPEVRALIGEVLSTRGYTILSAADPEEAERLEQDYSGKIDLLLTDMVMPVKSGAALAQALARKRPDMKILFMSGYADPTIAHSPAWKAGSPFIQKPFTPAHLAQRLRELLDRK